MKIFSFACLYFFFNNYFLLGPSESIDTIFKLKEEIKKLEDSNKSLRKIKDELERKIESKALIEKTTTDSNAKILHFK